MEWTGQDIFLMPCLFFFVNINFVLVVTQFTAFMEK